MGDPINTIIIPIVRTDFVFDCIESLRDVTSSNFQIIVINQAWESGFDLGIWFRAKLLESADLVVQCKWNYGFAQAANMGARIASTKYVTICNDDVIFLPGWWEGIEETFEKIPNALVVNPSSPNPPHWTKKDPLCTLEQAFNPDRIAMLKEQEKGLIIDGIMMWCSVFKREEWDKLGMFDERFIPGSGEDYDALARICQAGYRAVGTSLSWVWHYWSQSKDNLSGMKTALPQRRTMWNKLSTKGFGADGLWEPDCNQWGENCERTDPNVARMPL